MAFESFSKLGAYVDVPKHFRNTLWEVLDKHFLDEFFLMSDVRENFCVLTNNFIDNLEIKDREEFFYEINQQIIQQKITHFENKLSPLKAKLKELDLWNEKIEKIFEVKFGFIQIMM